MNVSQRGIDLIKSFGGLRLEAYQDGGGVWTCGYGHTRNVKDGDTCTQPQAEAWLVDDLLDAENDFNRCVTVPLNQNQFDALVSFFYNLGAPALEHSHTLYLLNHGDYQGFATAMLAWDHDNGKVVAGLLRRREAERDLFLKQV